MSQRIREKLDGSLNNIQDYKDWKRRQTGEYVDQFTTVPDNRTTEEILSQKPKCVMRHDRAIEIARRDLCEQCLNALCEGECEAFKAKVKGILREWEAKK